MPYFTRSPVWVLTLTLLLHAHALHAQADAEPGAEADEPLPRKQQKIELDVHPRHLIFTEPKRPDGTIDYVAALNKKYSEGVTQDNNAYRDLFVLFDYGDIHWDDPADDVVHQARSLGVTEREVAQRLNWLNFVTLRQHFDRLGYTKRDIEKYTDWHESDPIAAVQSQDVRAWLESNRRVLQGAALAVQKPMYWLPLVEGWQPEMLKWIGYTSVGYQQMLAKAWRDQAYLSAASGHPGEAVHAIKSILRLANHQAASPLLMTRLVGLSLDREAIEAIRVLVEHRLLPNKQIDTLLQFFSNELTDRSVAEPIALADRCIAMDTFAQLCAGRIDLSDQWLGNFKEKANLFEKADIDLDRALEQISLYYKKLALILEGEDYVTRQRLLESFQDQRWEKEEQHRPMMRRYLGQDGLLSPGLWSTKNERTDALVVLFLGLTEAPFGVSDNTRTEAVALQRMAMLALMIERYRVTHGQLPESVEQLSLDVVKKLPVDPYDGQRVRYKRTDQGFTVYTLGRNAKDDGGKQGRDDGDVVLVVDQGDDN